MRSGLALAVGASFLVCLIHEICLVATKVLLMLILCLVVELAALGHVAQIMVRAGQQGSGVARPIRRVIHRRVRVLLDRRVIRVAINIARLLLLDVCRLSHDRWGLHNSWLMNQSGLIGISGWTILITVFVNHLSFLCRLVMSWSLEIFLPVMMIVAVDPAR